MAHVAVNLTLRVDPLSATDSGFDLISDHLWDVEHASPNLHDSGIDADLGRGQLSISITASEKDFTQSIALAQDAIFEAIIRAGFELMESDISTNQNNPVTKPILVLIAQTAELVETMQIA